MSINPLSLRLCCLAIMAPALTSEAATRARDKLSGTPASPGISLMNGRDHPIIGMSNTTKCGREATLPLTSLTTATTAQVVTISKDLQKKLLESGCLVDKGRSTESGKECKMVNLGKLSNLSDLYRQQQLEVFGAPSILQPQQLNKLTNTTSGITGTSNRGGLSTIVTQPTSSNGTVSTMMAPTTLISAVIRSKMSVPGAGTSSTTSTSTITTAKKFNPDRVPASSQAQPSTSHVSTPSNLRTGMSNGFNALAKSHAPVIQSMLPVTMSPNISTRIPDTIATNTCIKSRAQVLDTVARRQRSLETRAGRLLRRLRRLQSRQAISHSKQQLAQFVEHQQNTLPNYNKNASIDLQTELLHSKSMSTAALVELVHKMQSSQSTLRQHLAAAAQEIPEPTKLDEEICSEMDRVSGHLRCNMSHLQDEFDSDATESSSGGESCDELDYDDEWDGKMARPPIQCRAEWHWAADRAAVAARWTWLQAQVSDLEYRIRQQYDIYKQIRASKGNVILGEPPPIEDLVAKSRARRASMLDEKIANLQPKKDVSPAINVSTLLSNVDKQSSQVTQQLGPLYTPHQSPGSSTASSTVTPQTPSLLNGFINDARTAYDPASPTHDYTFQAARCRPIKSYRKRKLLRTANLHQLNRKAARLSSVQCHCYPPITPCAMCGGRYNNTTQLEALTTPYMERVALVDVSFHPVLSFSNDVSLSTQFECMLKTGAWQRKPTSKTYKVSQLDRKRYRMKDGVHKYQRLKKNKSATILSSTKIRNKYEQKQLNRGLVNSPVKAVVTSSGTEKKLSRGAIRSTIRKHSIRRMKRSSSLKNKEGTSRTFREMKRRQSRNQSAFDINNIVIPYSVSASTRVEKLQYKEIDTPKWREVCESFRASPVTVPPQETTTILEPIVTLQPIALVTPEPPVVDENTEVADEEVEDLSDDLFRLRHVTCEVSEKKRFATALQGSSSTSQKRGRGAQRADSVSREETDLLLSTTVTTPPSTTSGLITTITDEEELIRKANEFTRQRSGSVSSVKSNRSRSLSYSELDDFEKPIIAPWLKRTFPLQGEDVVRLIEPPPALPRGAVKIVKQCTTRVITQEMVMPPPGLRDHHSDTESDTGAIVEDPDDPEWTVISERQQQVKQLPLVLKLAKR